MRKFLVLLLGIMIASCHIVPGMKFSEKSSGIEGMQKVIHSGQYVLRVIPVTSKLVYLQNLAVRSNLMREVKRVVKVDYAGRDDVQYVYRVQPSDVLEITSWEDLYGTSVIFGDRDSEEKIETVPRGGSTAQGTVIDVVVDSEGKIYFPFAGEVYVKNKTVPQIRRLIQQQMRKYFETPKITVRVKKYNSQFVIVSGKVKKPGPIPITDKPLKVFGAIIAARGMLEKGFWKNATLTRDNGQVIPINLHALYTKGNLVQNYVLRHGDILHIPIVEGGTAYFLGGGIEGGVRTLLLQNNTVSLSEAIGNAGGLSEITSNPKGVYVFRREPDRPFSEITAYHLDATSPASMVLADSFFLRPKDIVYADTSGYVRWNRVVSLITSVFTNPLTSVGNIEEGIDAISDNN